ncbi:MAG: ABC transporter substrate-binding protein, partial [Actinomycetota bacterium]|nr:ABC transporter substrate-binding protein [Actinomycetota bacterium]
LPQHAYANDPGVGAGNWHVVSRTDDTVTMQVVDQPGRPRLDEIEFRSYADSAALLDALRSGDVDVAGALPASDYDELNTIDAATAIHASDGDQWIMQLRIPESETRRAIGRAINRDDLVATVANDAARTSPIPIVARGYRWRLDDDESARLSTRLSYDPAAPDIAGPVTLYAPGDETGPAIAEYVTTALEELGLTVSESDAAGADIVIALRDPGDDPTEVLASYTCAGGIWCDPRYDAEYDVFAATTDTATRIGAVQEMVRLLAVEAPEVVLFEPDTLQGVRADNVTGLLREPSVERLAVFWPSVQQYSEAVPTSTLGGEDIPDTAFAAIAVGATVVAVGGYFAFRAFGTRRRRTHSPA